MKQLHIVTDLQYGSTGKGLFSAFLARDKGPDTIFTAWAPNAGHTVVLNDGTKLVTCALPSGIFTAGDSLKRIMIGPGSVINPDLLLTELDRFDAYMSGVELYIHENAAVVTEQHRQAEAAYGFKIGSTMKGVGEAVISKIRRSPDYRNTAHAMLYKTPLEGCVVGIDEYNRLADESEIAILEGAQGFSLSINQGFYPYTTSRDCTTHQLLSDCAIPNKMFVPHVYGVARTYPIRVANRHDKDGNQIGTSGPCYGDQYELEWPDIGVDPELTTVTKLPRRLFSFSVQQIADAVRMNGVDAVFLNFANYVKDDQHLVEIIEAIERHAPVQWLGTGPRCEDIVLREHSIS